MNRQGVILLAFVASWLMQSCCRGMICDCFDDSDASIGLTLNVDSSEVNAFSKSELLGTVFIQIDSLSGRTDTLDRIDSFDLTTPGNTGFGFSIGNYEGLRNYVYTNPCIYKVLNDSLHLNISIDQISTKGHFSGKCCSCYQNDEIKFSVNGVPQTHTGDGRGGTGYRINKP